jgi:hypothetical protein
MIHDLPSSSRRVFVTAMITGAAATSIGCEGALIAGDRRAEGERHDDAGRPLGDGGRDLDDAGTVGDDGGPIGNREPTWATVPTIHFTLGVAASISIAAYVSDADADPLVVTKNDVSLPPGVTYDAEGQRFVYDGIGGVAGTEGHVLDAEDGRA